MRNSLVGEALTAARGICPARAPASTREGAYAPRAFVATPKRIGEVCTEAHADGTSVAPQRLVRACLVPMLLLLAVFVAYQFWPREIRYAPGRLVAPDEPQQRPASADSPPFSFGRYQLTPLADYTIVARLLHSRRYRYELAHDLMPIDLALGWGRMSDEAVLQQLDISQGFRFYLYGWRGTPPIAPAEIVSHSANVHVIPASRDVESTVFHLPRGAVVKLRGSLVQARDPEGRTWTSSLTRTDHGPGACEVMYVTSAELVPTR